jgi:hypothetical protein
MLMSGRESLPVSALSGTYRSMERDIRSCACLLPDHQAPPLGQQHMVDGELAVIPEPERPPEGAVLQRVGG